MNEKKLEQLIEKEFNEITIPKDFKNEIWSNIEKEITKQSPQKINRKINRNRKIYSFLSAACVLIISIGVINQLEKEGTSTSKIVVFDEMKENNEKTIKNESKAFVTKEESQITVPEMNITPDVEKLAKNEKFIIEEYSRPSNHFEDVGYVVKILDDRTYIINIKGEEKTLLLDTKLPPISNLKENTKVVINYSERKSNEFIINSIEIIN